MALYNCTCTYSPPIRKTRYSLRNHAKLKLKLKAFGRLTENLSDLSNKGIAFHMRVPEMLQQQMQSNKTKKQTTIFLLDIMNIPNKQNTKFETIFKINIENSKLTSY